MIKIIFSLLPIFIYSQSPNDFNRFISQYGKTFYELEKNLNINTPHKKVSFGLEHRIYRFENYDVIAYEKDDTKTITQVSFLSKSNYDNKESWYNICKEMDQDSEYELIDSFIADDEDLYLPKIKFKDMLDILRKERSSEKFTYSLIYKKGKIYIYMSVLGNRTMYNVKKEFEPIN